MISQGGLGLDEVLLVPSASDILPNTIDIQTQLADQVKLAIPVIGSANFTTVNRAIEFAQEGALAILPSALATIENIATVKAKDSHYLVGAIVDNATNANALVNAGADVLQLVVTNDTDALVQNIEMIKATNQTVPLWVGPINDLAIAKRALAAGADTIIVANADGKSLVNVVTTVMSFAQLAAEYDGNVILGSDVKYSGDVVKALAAGAVAVMVDDAIMTDVIADNLFQISGGLRSGMGYTGSGDVSTLRRQAQFVQITAAGLTESHPHDVELTRDAPNYHQR